MASATVRSFELNKVWIKIALSLPKNSFHCALPSKHSALPASLGMMGWCNRRIRLFWWLLCLVLDVQRLLPVGVNQSLPLWQSVVQSLCWHLAQSIQIQIIHGFCINCGSNDQRWKFVLCHNVTIFVIWGQCCLSMQFQWWLQINNSLSQRHPKPLGPLFCPLNHTQLNDIPWLHSRSYVDHWPALPQYLLAFEQGYGDTGSSWSWSSARGGQTP